MTTPKLKPVKVAVTHFPFFPQICLPGQDVSTELRREIERIARRHMLKLSRLSARIELRPDPINPGTHYLAAEVTYAGHLPPREAEHQTKNTQD